MAEASEKQIKYAEVLGIENPNQYSAAALSEMIGARVPEGKKKPYQQASNPVKQQIEEGVKAVLINKTQLPNSYEFGSAKNRHKLYYEDVDELVIRIKQLLDADLLDEEIEVSDLTVKPEDFQNE